MTVRFVQTCDRENYSGLLEASSRSVIEYCRRFDCEYEAFVGLKRGTKPWHASLNRITILSHYLDLGYSGWVVYLDVDAYVASLTFDLPKYLEEMRGFAFIGSPSGCLPYHWWDMNIGVFAINLDHPMAKSIIRGWKAKLDAVSDEALAGENVWSEVIDDQTVFHDVLQELEGSEEAVHIDREIFNWDNRFIRQLVRETGTLSQREQRIHNVVSDLLRSSPDTGMAARSETVSQIYRSFVFAIYGAILLRRPDGGGWDAASQRLLQGQRAPIDELRSCFESEEFASKVPEFLRTYLSPETLAVVTRELAEAIA